MQGFDFVFSLAVLVMSVVIHEVSHGYAAYMLGDHTAERAGRLTLNPLEHMDLVGSVILPLFLAVTGMPVFGWAKPVPYNPYNLRAGKWGPAIVAAAGPLSNLVVAGVFAFFLRSFLPLETLSPAFVSLALQVVIVNTVLALFNLVPVPPIDGSKILFALLPYRSLRIQHWMERNEYILLFMVIFFVWPRVSNIVFFAVSLLLGPSASQLLFI